MKLITIIILTLSYNFCLSQVSKDSELYEALLKNDSLLFSAGLNNCNLKIMEILIHNDFEFYHDKGGIQNSKEEFFKVVKNGPCKSGKVENNRVLVPNSIEVFPLYNNRMLYGAIQNGKHQFGETTANFTHLWLITVDGTWQISRVLSFNH